MKKTVTISSMLLLAGLVLYAQPGFNKIEDLGFPANHLWDMIVDNDTIVGYGLAYEDSFSTQGLLIVQYDSSGNFIRSKIITDSLGDHLAIHKFWGKIINTSDGGYAMTAATFYRNSALLIKLKPDLEIEFIKEYNDTVNLSNYNYRITEIQDGYLLYGSIQRPNSHDQSFIRRVDDQGNTVWFNYYGDYNVTAAILDLRVLNDSVYAAGTVDGESDDIFGPYYSSIRLINDKGQEFFTWQSEPDDEIGYLQKLLLTEDGGYIIYGLQVFETFQVDKTVQPTLTKLNENFELEWIKHYGLIYPMIATVGFRKIERTIDGHFIGAGESNIVQASDPDLCTGWLFKFSEYGDSIWSRHDMIIDPSPWPHDHYFGGVGVLSSGNIVAAGSTIEGSQRYIWLVKVTNDGCLDTLYCGLALTPVEEVIEKLPAEWSVYPNPARNGVHVNLNNCLPKAAAFLLYDEIGRLRLNGNLATGSNYFSLNNLQKGFYFYEVRDNGRVIKTGKVVKVE